MSIAHGDFSVSLNDNIIMITLSGSFNEFGARAMISEIKAKIRVLDGGKFLVLVDSRELEGHTPGSLKELELYNQWLNGQNMIAKALVVTSEMRRAIADIYIPAKHKQNLKEFDDVPPALKWLKAQL